MTQNFPVSNIQIPLGEDSTTQLEEKRILFNSCLIATMDKIRQSLDVNTIFQTTTQQVRHLLNVSRVAIYRFNPDWSGKFVAEAFGEGFSSLIERQKKEPELCLNISECSIKDLGDIETTDTYLQETAGGEFTQVKVYRICSDIYNARFSDCYIQLLESYDARSYTIIAIYEQKKLWGLFAAYHSEPKRYWQSDEVYFLIQIAAQMGIALQQAEYLKHLIEQKLQLQKSSQQQKALAVSVEKIRRTLDIETIFQTTIQEVRELLNADRSILYRFNPDWSGKFIAESVTSNWTPLMSKQLEYPELRKNISNCNIQTLATDTYLKDTQGGLFTKGELFRVCNDIYNAGFSDCYIQVLESYQARAYTIIAVYKEQKLWGLLAAYQNTSPRHWQSDEIHLLLQIANHLGIAIKQTELLDETQQQATKLTEALKQLKQSQTQLIQTEKMVSLGQLVAGIAHEINNPINFIHGNLYHVGEYVNELLGVLNIYRKYCTQSNSKIQEYLKSSDLEFISKDLQKTLSSMEIGTARVNQIVLSLRNFSRLDEAPVKAVNIHQGIDNTILLLGHRLQSKNNSNRSIEIIKNYSNLPELECYPAQLNQVFMNILSNAIDALEEYEVQKNPKIEIFTENNDTYVTICIVDNGPGMIQQVQNRIFDPFFTTKTVGKGTGLGLSISYQIVTENHKGQLKCISNLGQGTQFYITIPKSH
ncbi:MAG: GAF domain-containing protein [Rhizonema sp. PD37]|nr:GAF domain-containing protein [Rhizonema sp. PD37]